jgi:hypothetical protein
MFQNFDNKNYELVVRAIISRIPGTSKPTLNNHGHPLSHLKCFLQMIFVFIITGFDMVMVVISGHPVKLSHQTVFNL